MSVRPQARWRLAVAVGAAMATFVAVIVTLLLISDPTDPAPPRAAPTPGPAIPTPALHEPRAPETAEILETQVLPSADPIGLEIGSIGVRTEGIIDLGLMPDRTLEVPKDAGTAGWYTESPTPGERGPAVVAGHVDYNHVPGVFYRLHELRSGAEARVHREDGLTAVFTIYRVERYPKSRFPTERVYGDTDGPELRLITCGGEFDRASGQYRDNIVAYGTLAYAIRR